MANLFVDSGGAATNSGSTDQNAANLSGVNATVAGSVVTLDGAPDLSGVVTSGSTQSSIYLAQATNTNRKIFWITAKAGATVTVDVAPTGVTGSAWAIGGRQSVSQTALDAARAGDTVTVNNNQTITAALIFRASGDTASGWIKLKGAGALDSARPVISRTNDTEGIDFGGFVYSQIEHLEINTSSGSGDAVGNNGGRCGVVDCKIVAPNGTGIFLSAGATMLLSEITGCVTGVRSSASSPGVAIGNYIHDNSGDGMTMSATGPNLVAIGNLIARNGGRGIYFSSAAVTSTAAVSTLVNNTIVDNLNSGIEAADADLSLNLFNNVQSGNGGDAGEYEIELLSAGGIYLSRRNLFAVATFLNFTPDPTDQVVDPQFVNGAGSDWRLKPTSLAKDAGQPVTFPGLSYGSLLDVGAVQRAEPAANLVRGGVVR